MPPIQSNPTINFHSDRYRQPFSRINGIVIEGEQEAYENFLSLAQLLPEHKDELTRLGRMEFKHRRSFEACGQNLKVLPDLDFAEAFFADLRQAFQEALNDQQIASCLLIQALIIECFAIAAYHNYIPVADDFARKVTEAVVADEYLHLNFGEIWLKANFPTVKAELEVTNSKVLPIIWRMLNQVETDAKDIGMNKQTLLEEFMGRYGEALHHIGFHTREVLQLLTKVLKSACR